MTSTLKSTLGSRLAAYATAGAAVAITSAAVSSPAAIVYVDPTDISIPDTIDGIYINLVTGATSTTGLTGYDINPYDNGAGLTFYGAASPSGVLATGVAGTSAVAQKLTAGTTISATPTVGFYNQFQTVGTAFQTPGLGYLGLRFLNESTGVVNYGWVEVSSGTGGAFPGFPASITRWAFENTGLSINAGQTTAVPEPGTTAALAMGALSLGAAGVRRWRQSKQVAA